MFKTMQDFSLLKLILLLSIFSISILSLSATDNFAGNCLVFDGNNDFASITKTLPDTGTIEFWLYPRHFYNFNSVFDNNIEENDWEMWIYDNGIMRFRIDDGSVSCDLSNLNGTYHWYHVAVTWEKHDTVLVDYTLYVDGILRDSETNRNWVDPGTEFYLAGGNSGNDAGDSRYDELRFWDTIRTETELNDNMYFTLDGSELGLANYYQFNESTGAIASDALGANNLTLHNMNDDDWFGSSVPLAPVLSTTVASSIDQTSAISGGDIVENSSASVSRGVCWSTSPTPTIADSHTDDGTGYGVFTSNMTGLIPNTEYYYRAYASNSDVTSYGEEYTFMTLSSGPPIVETTVAELMSNTSASSGGNITYSNEVVSQRGVCWSTNPNPTLNDNYTDDGTGIGSYTSLIDGLEFSTEYYYRAYAINSIGIAYGEEMTFSTAPIGDGTQQDPHQISCFEDLMWLSENSNFWDRCFIQTADIDASSTSSLNNGHGLSPIGNETINFTGTYDGQEYIIDGLFMDYRSNNDNSDNIGLFGYASGSEISNLGLTNADVTGSDRTGGLAGYCSDTSISNCYITGEISGNYYTGGLVGYSNNSSSITQCYCYSGSVSGWTTGGLVGKNNNASTISYSYSTLGTISSGLNAGFVGVNSTGSSITSCYTSGAGIYPSDGAGFVVTNENNSSIDNCYNTKVTNGENVAGFALSNTSGSTITNCYTAGSVEGYGDISSFVEYTSSTLISNCFWNGDLTWTNDDSPATELTTAEMQTLSTYINAGWDFIGEEANGTDDVWKFIPGNYPLLAWQASPPIVDFVADEENVTTNQSINFTNLSLDGSENCSWEWDIDNDGTVDYTTEDCSHIYSAPGVYSVSLTATNSLGTDTLVKSGYITVTASLLGSGTTNDPYQISNLDDLLIVCEDDSYWSASFIQTADIDADDTQNWNSNQDFSPIGNSIINFTGAYDGNEKTISNLYISRGNADNIGLFGIVQSATIADLSIKNANITGANYVGGLTGRSHDSIISNCSTDGIVNSNSGNSGGLVGEIFDNSSISNCYSRCNVNGFTYTGGLVGRNSLNSTITNCYSSGTVQGSGNVGGLVGLTSSSSSVTNSFWDIQTSLQNTSDGGIGYSTVEMQTMSTYTNAGWDFINETANGTENIWAISANSYPAFAYNNQAPVITSVYDVPNDQGRHLNVCWQRSSYDGQDSSTSIVSYNLWIQYPFASRGHRVTSSIEEARVSQNTGLRSSQHTISSLNSSDTILLSRDNDLWISVGATSAMGWEQYTMTATTYQDSSATEDNPSTFFVSAHTSTPSVYYCSNEVIGYSLDNIAPDQATNLQIVVNNTTRTNSITLNWDEVTQGTYQGNSYPELNGIWYRIYSADIPNFECSDTTIYGITDENNIDIDTTGYGKLFFKIIVSDFE